MHAVIRQYRYDAENAAEINRKVHDGFLPLIDKTPGFVAYYWIDTGSGTGASVSVFQDKAGADASVQAAAHFVRDNLAQLINGAPTVADGTVHAHG